MGMTAGATDTLLSSDLLLPCLALAHSSDPRPIPGGERFLGPGTELFHVFGIGPGVEESTITDFHGSIGAAQIQGKVRGTNMYKLYKHKNMKVGGHRNRERCARHEHCPLTKLLLLVITILVI
ncbi:MAG: hypothetical protein NVS2B12_38930 [Ktedonobacteraceae bacterium]